MKRFYFFIVVVILSFLIGWQVVARYNTNNGLNSQMSTNISQRIEVERIVGMGNWTETPTTVAALYEIADVVIRGRIIEQTEWLSSQTLPVYGPIDKAQTATPIEEVADPEKLAEIIGENVAYTPFTNSKVEVSEIFKGDGAKYMMVSQVGGTMPSEFGKEGNVQFVLEGNPILSPNDEYILFLTATPQTLDDFDSIYYLVHPVGGFAIRGEEIINSIDEFTTETGDFPRTLEELQKQIFEQQ